jgi:phage terminase large subunit
MPTVKIDLPDKLIPVFTAPNVQYRGAYGGRGGAKTIAFANMAIYEIMRPCSKAWRFLCGRELQKSLKDSVFSVIDGQIDELGVGDYFERGKEFIRCKNGNEFLFYGLRTNISEVKGLHGVRRTWLEEAQKVSESSLTYLIPTVMRDFKDCELWASWNPEDEDDPIHKMFVTNADDGTICAKINWYDNPWFPESLNRVRLRDKNNPQRYDWIWEGNFNVNGEGAVYAKWIPDERVINDVYDPTLPVHTSWDLGYSDTTCIWFWQIAGKEIRAIDFYENNGQDVPFYCDVLKSKSYGYGKHYMPHDAANKLLAAGGRSIAEQAWACGIKVNIVPATSQANQISATREILNKTWFDAEKCKEGVRCLRKYQFRFNEDKQRFEDAPYHDWSSHAADAFEIIGQVMKDVLPLPVKQEPRWLHEVTAQELFWGDLNNGRRPDSRI